LEKKVCTCNTKCYREAGLAAIEDAMCQMLWTRHIQLPKVCKYQQQQSIKIIRIPYCCQKTECCQVRSGQEYLYISYFVVTDRIKKGEVNGAYRPIENMLGDLFTEPLQGGQHSERFGNLILNTSNKHRAHRLCCEREKIRIHKNEK